MSHYNPAAEEVNKSNVSFLKSLHINSQSCNEFQSILSKPEQLENNFVIPITEIAQLVNTSIPCNFRSFDGLFLDNNIDVPSVEEYSDSDESENDIEDSHGHESVSLGQYEENEDVLMLRHVRQFISTNRNLKHFIHFIKEYLCDQYENTANEDVQITEIHKEPRLRNDFYYRFNTPYFKDRYLFSCGPNADTLYRRQHGLEQTTMNVRRKRNRWTDKDSQLLSDLIRKELIAKEIERLESEKRRLKREAVLNKGKTETCEVKDEATKCVLNKGELKVGDQSGEIKPQKLNKAENKIKIEDEVINTINSKDITELMNGKDDWKFDWEKISIIGFNNRYTSNECAQYWRLYLRPSINKEQWSKDEDDGLVKLATKYKRQNWEKISEELGTNRSPFQVFQRYFSYLFKLQPKSKLDYLPPVDDKELANVVKSCIIDGKIEWHSVSRLTGRPVKQLYNQWWYSSDPKKIKGKFTKEEDMIILTGFKELGYNSKMLSTILKHRSSSQILSRYKCLIPDGSSRGPWELHEDKLLLKLVDEYGFGEWSKIASQFDTRNRTQIRQRYSILQQKINEDKNFNVERLKRKKLNKIVNKSANVDKLVRKVKRKYKKFDFPLDEHSSKIQLINKLKTDLLPKKAFNRSSESEKADRKLTDYFVGNCRPCKHIRKCDVKNISDLAISTLYSLVYLNVTTLKTITRAEIENDDRISDLLKAVLLELMQEDVFDLRLVKQKLLKPDFCDKKIVKNECADKINVENDCTDKIVLEYDCTNKVALENDFIADWEIDYLAPSTCKQVIYKRITRNNTFNESPSSIDCLAGKREDSLVELKEQWLSSKINFKDVKISQLIHGTLDEFSRGVYNFIKRDPDCSSQTMTDLTPSYSISLDTKLPETTPQPLQNCNSNFDGIYPNNPYKLPLNLSSLIFLRTLEFNKIKLMNNLKNENIMIQDVNDLTNIILQQDNPSIIPDKINFNEKNNDPIMELPAKLLMKRLCDVLHWTILETRLPPDCVEELTQKPKRKKYKIGKNKSKENLRAE